MSKQYNFDIPLTGTEVYYYNRYKDEDRYQELLTDAKIEVVAVNDYNEDIRAVVQESYRSIDISIVIRYEGKLYLSEGCLGSYGADDFSAWYEVEAIRIVTVGYTAVEK